MTKRTFNFEDMTKKFQEVENKKYTKNDGISENLYTPKLDNDDKFGCILRFLPRPIADEAINPLPYAKLYNHFYQTDSGQWLVEDCPTSKGNDCPVCKDIRPLYESDYPQYSKRKRKLRYYWNVYIVKDPQNKENEGKVFIWSFGQKVYEKIKEKMFPEPGGVDEPVMVIDYEKGMNFKLKIKKVAGHNNYDSSEFAGEITPLSKDKKEIDRVDGELYSLVSLEEDSRFKSFDDLKNVYEQKEGKTSIAPTTSQPTPSSKKEEPKQEEEPTFSSTGTDEEDAFWDEQAEE